MAKKKADTQAERMVADREPHWVYFIGYKEINGMMKIGMSKEPERRLRILQVGAPKKLTMWGKVKCRNQDEARLLEKELHRSYAKNSVRGEWFRMDRGKMIALKSILGSLPDTTELEPESKEEIIETFVKQALSKIKKESGKIQKENKERRMKLRAKRKERNARKRKNRYEKEEREREEARLLREVLSMTKD